MGTLFESTDRGASLLDRTDPDILDSVGDEAQGWLNDVMEAVRVKDENELKAAKFKTPNKDVLSGWLEEVCRVVIRQRDVLADMQSVVDGYKSEIIQSRGTVIKVQEELLQCKSDELESLRSAVQTTVKSTVETEIKSYGDAVKKNLASTPHASISPQTLKKVVQNVIEVEDRNRNLLVFGLSELDEEQISERIGDVFLQLGEKPRLEASRLGRKDGSRSGACRPVKVTLASSTQVRQILMKAKQLRQVDRLKSVYISPDRSVEERAVQKQLILDLKKRTAEQPDLRHFIRGGRVCSVEKNGLMG